MNQTRILQAILRDELVFFIEKCFGTISKGDRFIRNWHIDAIAHELSSCRHGTQNRLLVTQPPRSLKSISTSVAYVAWMLGHNPALRFICVSYSQDLALELSRQFRLVVDAGWYKDLFPNMRLKRDSGNECITAAGGGRLATSIGGTLTGRGADCIIVDDPMKAEESLSESARKRVIDWYTGTLATRLNDKKKGVIIVVMQRLHEEDLAGYVLERGGWKHLNLPAIAEEDERIEVGSQIFHVRKKGDVLQPVREPMEVLKQQRSSLGSLAFSAQYQQRPVPQEGNIVKREWLMTYASIPDEKRIRFVQSWDIATSTKATADYSACVTAAIWKNQYYVVDVWRGRLDYPSIKKKIISHAQRYKANSVLIERAGPGLQLIQEFRRRHYQGLPTPISIRPHADKAVRLEATSAVIESGSVFLPEDAPWIGSFLNELLAFPNGRNDDQVDAFSQLINWREKRSSTPRVSPPIIVRRYG